jgi:hypothetical protein
MSEIIAGDIIDWRLLTGEILLRDIMQAIFCWRYFFRESGIWGLIEEYTD